MNAGIKIYYCRKVFATFLRNKGIEPEIIDLLQGRISSSVFVQHYYRPDINEMIASKVRPALNSEQDNRNWRIKADRSF
jgi:intergrase/recombinase